MARTGEIKKRMNKRRMENEISLVRESVWVGIIRIASRSASNAGRFAPRVCRMDAIGRKSFSGNRHPCRIQYGRYKIMPSLFRLSRVYRYRDGNGFAQLTDFPDDPPSAANDLEARIKHFTEIENFTFLGYVLAHELGGSAKPLTTFSALQVPDREFQDLVNKIRVASATDEELGDTLLDVGINWEHFVASNNDKMIPGNPLKVKDTVLQEKIDSLDEITEALVSEINKRSV